jgi:hypothetical protein
MAAMASPSRRRLAMTNSSVLIVFIGVGKRLNPRMH